MVSKAKLRMKFTCKSAAHIQASRTHYKLCLQSLTVRRLITCTYNLSAIANRRAVFYCLTYEKLT